MAGNVLVDVLVVLGGLEQLSGLELLEVAGREVPRRAPRLLYLLPVSDSANGVVEPKRGGLVEPKRG